MTEWTHVDHVPGIRAKEALILGVAAATGREAGVLQPSGPALAAVACWYVHTSRPPPIDPSLG